MSSAKFASEPMAWRAASRSPHCAKWTIAGRHTLATSKRTSGSSVTLQRHAATSRWISSSAERPALASAGSPPLLTKRRRFSGSFVNRRSAANARHWLWMLFDWAKNTSGGTPPARPIWASRSGSELKFATLNVAYSRTEASGESVASAMSTLSAPLAMTAGWFASLDVTFTKTMSAWRCESRSLSSDARSNTAGNPPWTMIWT
mmetsp:Transcript_18741/g.65061  ORF Transcript_18741/g.65061 Transcript_18741/m.65061 type:complete len:204 (-) Transcript_18741:2851-3462(-)